MNAVHAHLLLNHLPPFCAAIGAALLACALYKPDASLRRAGLLLMLLAGISAPLVFLTGERAEGVLEKLPGWSEELIERHEEAAEAASWACAGLAAVALWALRFPGAPGADDRRGRAALGVSLAALALLAWAALRGGQIRHSELDLSPRIET